MKMKVILTIFCLLMSGLVFSDIGITNYEVVPETITVGSTGALVLTITNGASYEATGLKLDSFSSGGVYSNHGISIGEINPGGSTVISVPFYVEDDAEPGVYTLKAVIRGTYQDSSLDYDERDIYRTIEIPIIVENPAQFSIISSTQTVTTDDDFYVDVTIKNTGGVAGNAELTIMGSQSITTDNSATASASSSSADVESSSELSVSDSSSFYLLDENPMYLGDIETEINVRLHLSISASTQSGKNKIPLTLTYRDSLGQTISDVLYLTLSVNKQSPEFQIRIDEAELSSGLRDDLHIFVTNTGNLGAYNVRLGLDNNDALVPIGDSQVFIGDLKVGETQSQLIRVGVNEVQPDFYTIPFDISYEDSNGEEQESNNIDIGIEIEPLISFSSFVDAKPSPLVSGSIHTLSIQVSNTGSSSVKSLSVEIDSEHMTIVEAQDKQFIGALDGDDFSTLQYKVKLNDVEDGVYPINIKLNYKDSYNQDKEFNDIVMVRIYSQSSASQFAEGGSDNTMCIMGIVLIIIVGGVLVWHYKFRGNKPKSKG